VVLAYGLDGTKLQCGLPPRLGGRHAGTQILLSLQGKMLGHLFMERWSARLPVVKSRGE